MNRIAYELLMVAKELTSMEFPTQDALDKYLKDHPDANRSKHKVVKNTSEEGKKDDDPNKKWREDAAEDQKKRRPWLDKFESLVRKGGGKTGVGMWTNGHMHYGQGLTPEQAAEKYLSWAKEKKSSDYTTASELVLVAKELEGAVDSRSGKIKDAIGAIQGYAKWTGKTSEERELINAIRLTIKRLNEL